LSYTRSQLIHRFGFSLQHEVIPFIPIRMLLDAKVE